MTLRKGKTKTILESSIDSALLAVEVYNKPRTTFRSQAFITLMIIAWTRLMHAHFHNNIGEKYFYKDPKKPKRYSVVDGEKKAWDLTECIKQYKKFSDPIKKNLDFFIKLRNKIEHRHIDANEIDVSIFGECQSMLINYENTLVDFFGNDYSINEGLVYSLQFSYLRTKTQQKASHSALSKDTSDILQYIQKVRSSLPQDTYNSQEFSVKLIQIPSVSNNDRNSPAIDFVRWDDLTEEDKKAYEKITTLIKNKNVVIEGANVRRFKPSQVTQKINELLPNEKFTINTHNVLWPIFNIRPKNKAEDPFETNSEFCLYDESHGDYVYQPAWIEFIVNLLQSKKLTIDQIRGHAKNKTILNIDDYKI